MEDCEEIAFEKISFIQEEKRTRFISRWMRCTRISFIIRVVFFLLIVIMAAILGFPLSEYL